MNITPFYQEPNSQVYCGHALDVLAEFPAESVDCVPTSPPYWGLRSYKTEPIIWDNHKGCEHEWGDYTAQLLHENRNFHSGTQGEVLASGYELAHIHKASKLQAGFCLKCGAWRGELGLEPTIELYISHLLQIFDEVKRVLKKTGTLWVNIGDSYASGKGTCVNPGGGKGSFSSHGDRKDAGIYPLDRGNISMLRAEGLIPKSLCLIPERFALGMLERGWILRNNIIWYKPNPMPESVKDRFTGAYEYLYFFTKSRRYWFEQQFERGIMKAGDSSGSPQVDTSIHYGLGCGNTGINKAKEQLAVQLATLGYSTRNKRDVWEINTEPSSAYLGIRNFATFPEKLVETPIMAGCPSMICKKCGKARKRIYEQTGHINKREPAHVPMNTLTKTDSTGWDYTTIPSNNYTDCGCNAGFEPGVVMDIFAGSGPTGAVAKRLGRKYIGVDLSPAYCKLHKRRLQAIPLAMELVT